jgi:hypothetical protein
MAKAKFINDTTLTRLGDQYQYLIALECCINAKSEEDIIYIEQRGDVATSDETTEVKHHSDREHKISDRHTDFWKTLKNWVENYEVISSYKKYVLLTTSGIQEKSKLVDWNVLSKEEKLKQIVDIKEKKTTDTIKPFVEVVFTFNEKYTEKTLKEILDKFCISYNQPVIEDKVKELLEQPFFKPFPKKNRMPFLDLLMGYILSAGRENAENWQIKISEFNGFVEKNSKNYTSDSLPIPDTYKNVTTTVSTFENRNFVKELKKVDLNDFVQDAVNDYFRTQKTVIDVKNNDLFFTESFSHYQDNVISADLRLIKSNCELDVIDRSNEVERIKHSKRTYFEAMQLELKQIKGYVENKEFFQRGTIHTIVDSEENDFCWGIDE